MKSETEIRDRILYWREIREGILIGASTKDALRHVMEELLWVIGEEYEPYSKDNYIEIDRRPSGAVGIAVGVKTLVPFPKDIFSKTSISTDEVYGHEKSGH